MGKKVSIITPCYNGEQYVGRYLASILSQTYPDIQLIMVNDGSQDKTEQVILSYQHKFAQAGLELIYIFQENAGQAAALNTGLAVFTGDYLTWPDSDDFLAEQSIAKKVAFLENNLDYGFVRSDGYLYDEQNLNKPLGFISRKTQDRFKTEIFMDLIRENNIYFAPGCYMVRSTAFLAMNPHRQIYPSRAGQNWQMLLPMAFAYKCGYLDEPLYNYIVRSDSHSHSVVLQADLLRRCDDHEDILKHIINGLDLDKVYYNQLITEKYVHKRLGIAGRYGNEKLGEEYYAILKGCCCLTKRDRLSYWMSRYSFFNLIIRGLSKVRRVMFK